MTYLPLPDPLETEPRYTSVDAVKKAVGIDDSSLDDAVKLSIVTVEWMIDSFLGTSYPQDPEPDPLPDGQDPLDPPPVEGIPEALRKAALLAAIRALKLDETPYGSAGGEPFFGEVTPDTAGRAFNSVKPILIGLRRRWGIG